MTDLTDRSSAELVVLVPTRLRPHTVQPIAEAFAATCTAATWLWFCVDGDPDTAYLNAVQYAQLKTYPRINLWRGPRRRLVGTLNYYATSIAAGPEPAPAIGYLGDDHRPETFGWDTYLLAALADTGPGIVYGDDGVQHANLPTAAVMSASVVAALGHMAPPQLVHMYCDTYWRDLGRGADCLTYLPEVRITHHHPSTGVTPWDASYRESNSGDQYTRDEAAYLAYLDRGALDADIDIIRKLR